MNAHTEQHLSPSSPQRLTPRDAITIGIYTVLYFVLIAIGAVVTHLLPFGLPFMGAVAGVLGGVPYLLILMKIRRFGALTIMGLLLALIMGLMHGNLLTLATALVASSAADALARVGSYRSHRLNIASAAVFNLWNIGMFLPFYIGRDDYLTSLAAKHNLAYAQRLAGLFPLWSLPVLIVLGLLGGFIGGVVAHAMIRRHFRRAGLV